MFVLSRGSFYIDGQPFDKLRTGMDRMGRIFGPLPCSADPPARVESALRLFLAAVAFIL